MNGFVKSLNIKYFFLLIFFLLAGRIECGQYYSQYQQDQWINENIFKNKKNGIFLDIGAHDGKTLSNTYFFEKDLNWTGICVEPMAEVFNLLKQNRSCICINGGIGEKEGLKYFMRIHGPVEMLSGIIEKYDPMHLRRIYSELKAQGGNYDIIKIQTLNINNILKNHNISSIDFLSLDTEGGELEILKSIDFEKYSIKVISVENNYNDKNFEKFLSSKGYKKVKTLCCDEVYLKKE